MIIRAEGADFLDADSFVELQQLVRHYAQEIAQADVLGRLTLTHVRALRISVSICEALSDEIKDLIADRLTAYGP